MPASGPVRVSVVQMTPGADKAENIVQAEALLRACHAADRPDLMILPEVWSCLGGDRAGKLAAAETLGEGAAYAMLRGLAAELRVAVHGGSIGERDPDGAVDRIYNTTVVFDAEGREIGRYRKMHLFDIVTPDGQGYRESATYAAGDQVVTCVVAGVTLGLAICYDLRFAELFAALRLRGAELIALPSAFTALTGRDHWEPLLRARAIETQCWVAAAATTGRHVEIGHGGAMERQTYGHSMICDPWGHVVARASDGPGWATARMDAALTARVRRDMPVASHRRLGAM